MSANVKTAVALISGERRVFYEIPANGLGLHELDALQQGIEHARHQLREYYGATLREPQLPPEPCG